ncbi:NTP transferase domain-containing protein [Thermoactinomyces mirandus]|uniref:NTP transferase domain-containing protein n=1 Tax=Thermoactinomyces mirandus TaxID=2756294 RepID=A0A7W2ARI0_9BACL|nr:NTP transferase domain-containing protein [Thermoactinomyces mirandus]MBA4602377.1 NTP transferase domain-containing protein [Thermoactinomyces mirandus]
MKTAIILAAGLGRKMWPYNEYWPKAALPVGNQPNIERLIHSLKDMSFERIIIVTHYLHKRVQSIVYGHEGVEVIRLPFLEGTADSLSKAVGTIRDDHILVIYGDIAITRKRLQYFVDHFHDQEPDGLVLCKPVDKERPQDWICARLQAGKVEQIFGHPRPHYVTHRLLGIYALRTEALRMALIKNPGFMQSVSVGVIPSPESELEQALQILIEHGNDIMGHVIEDGAVDMDKPWDLMEANIMAVKEGLDSLTRDTIPDSATIHPTAQIDGKIILGENVKIGRNVMIEGNVSIGAGTVIDNGVTIAGNAMIGKHCTIRDFCRIGPYSVIGNGNRIGHCAEFAGVTFDRISFVHYGEVYGVIGESTDIAAGVTVGIMRFDDQPQNQRVQGRMEMPVRYGNAVYFGDFTRTGIASQYMPGVKVGCNCAIGPGVMVARDVPSNTLLYTEQKLVQKKWGPEKYGW